MEHVRSWPRRLPEVKGAYLLFRQRVTFSLFLCLFPVATIFAGPLDQYFANLKTFSADFSQTLVQGMDQMQNTRGILYIKSPDKFRLEYTAPYVQIYVADGKKLWQYDEDLEQVIIKPQGQILANSPLIVLSNAKNLHKNYHVEPQGTWNGQKWYMLKPKSADTNFEQVRLAFKGKKLSTMELKDSFGQFSRLTFQNVKNNIPLSESLFTFTPPEGVDVITE